VLLDTAQGLPVDAGGLDRAMTHDGVHLTPAAHALWGARIEAALPPAAQDRP
jgi:lysophospholipase L1-like esterase